MSGNGFRHEIKRSTLADAKETRDWHIHAEFAQCLIVQARKLDIGDSFGIELEKTAKALDSTTINLCLLLFPWALFRTNSLTVRAAIICALYKVRWQVALFFKWIKQHLRIKKFYGNREDALAASLSGRPVQKYRRVTAQPAAVVRFLHRLTADFGSFPWAI